MKKKIINFYSFFLILIILIGFVSSITWDNVAYWSMDESSGNVKDSSGNEHNGVISGNPVRGVEGKIRKAIDFNYTLGSSNYVNTSDIDLNGSLSLSLWAIQKEIEDGSTLISKRDRWGGTNIEIHAGGGISFCLRTVSENSKKGWTRLKQIINTLSRIFFKRDLKNYTFYGLTALEESCATSNFTPSLGEWHHLVAVYDEINNKIILYLDGENVAESTHKTGLPLNNKNYIIGANAMGVEGFDGGKGGDEGADDKIDEVGIWNRALSSEEVKELYNSGKGLSYGDQII